MQWTKVNRNTKNILNKRGIAIDLPGEQLPNRVNSESVSKGTHESEMQFENGSSKPHLNEY
jgi:hypothetical protein